MKARIQKLNDIYAIIDGAIEKMRELERLNNVSVEEHGMYFRLVHELGYCMNEVRYQERKIENELTQQKITSK